MVMELGDFSGTRWTNNSPRPFSRAPGAGFGDVATQRRPRRAATTDYDSGFAADPVNETFEDEQRITVDTSIKVKRLPVAQGEIPSALVKLQFTDRGTLSKENLDANVHQLLKHNGFRVSLATSLTPVDVTWAWKQDPKADLFFPVIKTPKSLAGIRYAGSAIDLGLQTTRNSTLLAKLPNQVYVYSFAVTSPQNNMTDADSAKLLTLIKQAYSNMHNSGFNAYGTTDVTLLGSPTRVFDVVSAITPAVLGLSGIVLLIAYNMIAQNTGADKKV